MKHFLFNSFLFSLLLIALVSCNHAAETKAVSDTTTVSKSEFKDSTSFAVGVKVFVKPTARMKVIERIHTKNDTTYYFVDGKDYKAADLKSLD